MKDYAKEVLQGAKAIFSAGLVEFGEGNVSHRVKRQEELFITPTRNDYGTLQLEEIVHINFDGEQISKGRPPSSEYRLHTAVYHARPKAQCVIHTHSPYASMLSMVGLRVPALFEEAIVFLGGDINVAEYGQAGTDEIGKNALLAMGDSNGVLLQNHGVLVCARTMDIAVKSAQLVEKLAKIYIGARSIGEVKTINKKYWDKFLTYYRGLYRTAP